MKKYMIVVAVAIIGVVVLSAAGLAYAQTRTPDQDGYGPGTMGGRGGRGPGMMGGAWGRGAGPIHEFFEDALAEALDLTPEAVEERIEAGETPWEIAASTGLDEEQVAEVLNSAHSAALDAAVAAGVITQEQADWMNDHMQGMWAGGYGAGPCHGGGRWNRP